MHNIPTSTIKVTNISLYDNSLCSIEPFSSIVITLENIPKGEIREAKLTKIDDNKTEIVFLQCDIDEYKVFCSKPNEDAIKGEYQLTSIEGDDLLY